MSDYLCDLGRQDLARREKEQKEMSIQELKKVIAEGEASGMDSNSMNKIKVEARKELGL